VGKADIPVTNSGVATEGGAAGWDRTGSGGELWAGRRPISFPGRCSPSGTCGPCCRSGSGRNVAAALGCPGGGRAAAAVRFVAAGRLAAVRGGGSAGVPKRRVLPRAGRGGGGSSLLGGLGHPQCVATLNHLLCSVEGPRVDQSADVAWQFAEEEGDLRLLQRRLLQGGQIVPPHRGPGVAAAHRIIQPLAGPLFVSKAVGSQEELLQLPVRVGDGGGVARQRADRGAREKGSLDMAQWNFVIDWVMFAMAKVGSRQSNQHCGESA
jgi:hypothetical protein